MASNLPAFIAQIKRAGAVSKKPFAAIVNRALKNVAFRAMQFTAYAEPGMIQAELYRDGLALKLAARKLSRRAGRQVVDRYGNTKVNKRGKAVRYGGATQAQIRAEATKIIQRRIASSRASRAGWIPAVRGHGGSVRGEKLRPGSSASKGSATKATVSRLSGVIRNALVTRNWEGKRTSVENIPEARAGLEKAIRFVTADMGSHREKKEIERALQTVSDR